MLNEATFRSPKWLRNYIDFELNTGKDIKGEPSKRSVLKQWDRRWKECNDSDLDMFYSLVIRGDKWPSHVGKSELEEFREKYRGDMSIWQKWDEWYPKYKEKEEKRKKEAQEYYWRKEREEEQRREREHQDEQRKIEKELDDLFKSMVRDFSNNPYNDKFSTPRRNGNVCFDYRFENGDTFKMCENEITWGGGIYTVGLTWRNKFVSLCNEISSKARQRPGGSKSSSGSSSRTRTTDPNRDRYDKLVDNIKLREQQLKVMSKTDPQRSALENELDNYKRAAKRMKDRYQFEHLSYFKDFIEKLF